MRNYHQAQPMRRYHAVSLSTLAARMVDRSLRQRGFVHTRIVRDWERIAGVELAKVTLPLEIRFPRGKRSGATLILRCLSAFAPLAQHHAPRLIADVNRYFGYPAIEQVSIRQGPIPLKKRSVKPQPPILDAAQREELENLLRDAEKSAGRSPRSSSRSLSQSPSQSPSGPTAADRETPVKAALRRLGEAVFAQAP